MGVAKPYAAKRFASNGTSPPQVIRIDLAPFSDAWKTGVIPG
jgi:hypothetical protein